MRLRRETAALPIPPCYHPSSSFQREELQYSLEFDLRCHPECTICCIVLKYVLLREEKYLRWRFSRRRLLDDNSIIHGGGKR